MNPHMLPPDRLLVELADYTAAPPPFSEVACREALHCLLDTLGCAMLALQVPACSRLLGPVVPGASMTLGARIPGTGFELDPVTAAFGISCCASWLELNDHCLAIERSRPSENLGAILAVADWASRNAAHPLQLHAFGAPLPAPRAPLSIRDVLVAIVKTHEIQGALTQESALSRDGCIDPALLVRVASAAVATHLLGGTRDQILDALSLAWTDGFALRAQRHAYNAISWQGRAAGDASSRAVLLALRVLAGEPGCLAALTSPHKGVQDPLLLGHPLVLARPLGCSMMEQTVFKLTSPAGLHAQTALEAAAKLHPLVAPRLADVKRVEIVTHANGAHLLAPPAPEAGRCERQCSLPFVVALGLVFGRATVAHFEDAIANDPRIAALCARAHVQKDSSFGLDHHDADRHSLANAVQVHFRDGSHTERINVKYPIGHYRRRIESLPLLFEKAEASLLTRFDENQAEEIVDLFDHPAELEAMPVNKFMDLWVE